VKRLLLSVIECTQVSDARQLNSTRATAFLMLKLLLRNIKSINRPGGDQIQGECEKLHSEIHKLSNSIRYKEESLEHWNASIIVPIHKGDRNDRSNYRGISLRTKFHPLFFQVHI
jgi:hypothetical protein